jgi:hypothetical protein
MHYPGILTARICLQEWHYFLLTTFFCVFRKLTEAVCFELQTSS